MTRWTDWFYFRILCISMFQTFLKPKSKEIKNLIAGPWAPFLLYRSFYRTPRIIFPSNYFHSTLVLVHTSTWKNQNFSFTFTWRTPTSNSISVQNYFWLHSAKASLFYPPSLCPTNTSESLMTSFYQSEIPSPMTCCKYLKIYIKLQDIQETQAG